jgi:hypothetical protein
LELRWRIYPTLSLSSVPVLVSVPGIIIEIEIETSIETELACLVLSCCLCLFAMRLRFSFIVTVLSSFAQNQA